MKRLTNLSQESRQRYILTGDDREEIEFILQFYPSQGVWCFDVNWEGFSLKNISCVLSPNMLRAYKNIIPFGIGSLALDGVDPYRIDDFISQRVQLFLLNREDVLAIEDRYF